MHQAPGVNVVRIVDRRIGESAEAGAGPAQRQGGGVAQTELSFQPRSRLLDPAHGQEVGGHRHVDPLDLRKVTRYFPNYLADGIDGGMCATTGGMDFEEQLGDGKVSIEDAIGTVRIEIVYGAVCFNEPLLPSNASGAAEKPAAASSAASTPLAAAFPALRCLAMVPKLTFSPAACVAANPSALI